VNASSVSIDAAKRTVLVTIPLDAYTTGDFTPVIATSGVSVSPGDGVAQTFFSATAYTPVEYTVTAENGAKAVWTVMVRLEPLPSDTNIGNYLNGKTGSASAPVFLPLDINLSGSGWTDLLSAINTAGDYVALDLSACDISGMTGTEGEFAPGVGTTGVGKIVSLVLPGGATSVKAGSWSDPTFENFSALTSVTGTGIESVGGFAFYECTSLETLSLPAATSIGEYAFYGRTGLETLSLPAATSIGEIAFAGCIGLETVSLPAATSIGNNAFGGCIDLRSVSLPASLTSIGVNPFSGCTGLTSITVAPGNPAYKAEGGKLLSKDGKTLIGYPSATGELAPLPGITSVGNSAFVDGTGLTSVSLPAATSIGDSAFYECTSLETVDLRAATSIGGNAFYKCTSLETMSLPAATSIGEYAFFSCTGLETVNLSAATNIGAGAFGFTGDKTLTVTLGAEVPALGREMFYIVSSPKNVTVEVPSGAAAWNGKTGTFNGANTDVNWGNGFRGGGWTTGSAFQEDGESYVNSDISLTIGTYTP
jgi:hypothetical protein